jgi:hypothetical protein
MVQLPPRAYVNRSVQSPVLAQHTRTYLFVFGLMLMFAQLLVVLRYRPTGYLPLPSGAEYECESL